MPIISRFVKGIAVCKHQGMDHTLSIQGTNLINYLRQEQRKQLNHDDRWSLFAKDKGTCKPGSLINVTYHPSRSTKYTSTFSGILIAIRRHTSEPTIIVRSSIDGMGVEQIFCVFSPLITKIQVVRRASKWKGNKLYWLRERPEMISSFYKTQASTNKQEWRCTFQ